VLTPRFASRSTEGVINARLPGTASNVWHGIVPLRSTRAEVELLLGGTPTTSFGSTYRYNSSDDRVDILYSVDPCKPDAEARADSADYVVKITVMPKSTLLISNLRLDKSRYLRVPNDHPENWIQYLNSEVGITIDAMVNDGCEQVRRIIYQAPPKERRTNNVFQSTVDNQSAVAKCSLVARPPRRIANSNSSKE
jgi:hypothetical protein